MAETETSHPNDWWKRLRVEYYDVGFFNGYYVWKGYDALLKLPNWLGRIIVNRRHEK